VPPFDEEEELEPEGPSIAQRIVAAVMVLVFGAFALGTAIHFFFGPDLSFISRSHELAEKPGVRELQQAVVRIEAYPEGSPQKRTGTGFNIDGSGLIVTNRHVVDETEAVTVTFRSHGSFTTSNIVEHSSVDLALISLKSEDLPTVAVTSGTPPARGQAVVVIGNPLGYTRVVAEGTVTAYRHAGMPGAPLLQLEAPIHPGSSGSPVFNASHEVVAVVFAVLSNKTAEEEERRALAIPVSYLQTLLPE
jgi:S1-C subfamily serine protease